MMNRSFSTFSIFLITLLLGFALFSCQSSTDSGNGEGTDTHETTGTTEGNTEATSDENSDANAEEGETSSPEAESLDMTEFLESESAISYYYANVDNLNLRDEPNLKGKVIHTAKEADLLQFAGSIEGEELTLTLRGVEYTSRWYKVMDPKTENVGWVFGGAIVPEDRFFIVEKGGRYPDLQSAIDAVQEERGAAFIKIREGEYVSDKEIDVDKNDLTIEGLGKVKIQCTSMDANVFWTEAYNLTFRNLQASHIKPEPYASCVGNVFTLDIGDNILIENCEINGCGRVGVYFNGGNQKTTLIDNWIHSNTLAAIIDGEGAHMYEEQPGHPYITFKNNKIEDNGTEEPLHD